MKVVGIIPARLESVRLPGKVLLDETGKPLIMHVWENAAKSRVLSDLAIATDSIKIRDEVELRGAHCIMTGKCKSGTDRVWQAAHAKFPDADIVVNIQADEPEVLPSHIDALVSPMLERLRIGMSTLATVNSSFDEQPSTVKVVTNGFGEAMYFSRSIVPYARAEWSGSKEWLHHVGIYAYRQSVLSMLATSPKSKLELAEDLEQLRALELGVVINVVKINDLVQGVDTQEDYKGFVARSSRRKGRENKARD